jgi:hypothetical protein
MIKLDENSKAQSWELEVTCKDRVYLNEVVTAILKYGIINFEVEVVESYTNHDDDDKREGSYTVLMWCSWFSNLGDIANDLKEIENRLEKEDDKN